MRLTVAFGLDAAEEFLGLRSEAKGANGGEQAEAFAAKILSTRNFLAKMDFLHQKLPALEAARGVLRSRKADREQRLAGGSGRAVSTISMSQAIELTWEGFIGRRACTGASFSPASAQGGQKVTVTLE